VGHERRRVDGAVPEGAERRLLVVIVTVTVLAGGVGAARYLGGLIQVVDPSDVIAIVNTGDDTVMHGLAISPDLDTITYTLAGATDTERGWGLAGESWHAMEALARYSGVRPDGSSAGGTWFSLGDRDLATHMYRTARLAEGATLTEVTAEIVAAWGLGVTLLPMTDEPFRTRVTVDGIEIDFQDYFVRLRHGVAVSAIGFHHDQRATLTEAARRAIDTADTIVIAPSNPLVSIAPIRHLSPTDELLTARRDDVVAVSPIVGGTALKGPADAMMRSLGVEPTVVGVARMYAPVSSTLVIDDVDAPLAGAVEAEGMRCLVRPTVMSSPEIAAELAAATLAC
jgi:LPPG:FO 2-phospho-L-lactate transferase